MTNITLDSGLVIHVSGEIINISTAKGNIKEFIGTLQFIGPKQITHTIKITRNNRRGIVTYKVSHNQDRIIPDMPIVMKVTESKYSSFDSLLSEYPSIKIIMDKIS